MKIIAENRKAYHDYLIEDKIEAGLVLTGSEIKSIRSGKVNLKDSYARLLKNEIVLLNMHISVYDKTSVFPPDPLRTRKLLLNRAEIDKIERKVKIKGYSLIPLKLYLKNQFAKVELGVAKGKQLHDKREALREKAAKREIEREFKNKIK